MTCTNSASGFLPQEPEVWDVHAHIGTMSFCTSRSSAAEDIVAYMERMNFKKTFISSLGAIGDDFKRGNDDVLHAVLKYPDKLFGYVTVNPNYPDGTIREIERLRENKNIVGIKIHPAHSGVAVNAKSLYEVYEYANERHSLVLVHTWSEADILGMREIAEKYPEIRLIMAHAGAYEGVRLAAEVIGAYDNVYCDFPVGSAKYGVVEYLVKHGGSDKIFFGTDSTLFDHRITYGRLLFSDIKEEDKIKIFSLNIKRVFKEVRL